MVLKSGYALKTLYLRS
jgi:hypothetical protein